MSDWNRYGRQDDERRYGSDERDRRRYGRDEPWQQQGDSRERERRSFGEREDRQGSEDQQRGRWTYGSQDYRAQEPRRGGESDMQRFGGGEQRQGQGYSEAWSRGAERQGGYGGAYGQSFGQQDYARQDRGRERYGQGGGQQGYGEGRGMFGGNEPLQRVSEGEFERGHGAQSMGQGQHRGRGPKNYTRSDERIREDVNDRLSDDPWLDASEIEVQVSKCEVTLTGTVSSRDDKRRAEDIAEQVSGVKHVQNNVRVQQHGAGAQTQQTAGQTSTTGGAETGRSRST
jgi:osmotically-inducible protein OsmY